MKRVRQRSSVRWRIVLIYFLLVFIAMTIVSVYLLDKMKTYQMDSVSGNVTGTIHESKLLTALGRYSDLSGEAAAIQEHLDSNWSRSFSEELSVVSTDFLVCASTNPAIIGLDARDIFDAGLLLSAFVTGGDTESDSVISGTSVKNLYTGHLRRKRGVTGLVYVRADRRAFRAFCRSRS